MRYNLEPNGQLRIVDDNSSTSVESSTPANNSIDIDYRVVFVVISGLILIGRVLIAFAPWKVWKWIIGAVLVLVSILTTLIVISEDDEDTYNGIFFLKCFETAVSLLLLIRFGVGFTVILQCTMIASLIEMVIMYIVMIINVEYSLFSLITGPILFVVNIIIVICSYTMF